MKYDNSLYRVIKDSAPYAPCRAITAKHELAHCNNGFYATADGYGIFTTIVAVYKIHSYKAEALIADASFLVTNLHNKAGNY